MKITLVLSVTKTDGHTEPPDVVAEALGAALEAFVFEAGDDPSVYEVDYASLRDAE